MFSIIAAVGKNNEIGKNNKLLFHIKDDMKFFREKTLGHKVVMGNTTWDSLPAKLKDRENIVIAYTDFGGPDRIIHDVDKFIQENKKTEEEIFIIGGGMIYKLFLPHAKTIYLTEIEASDPEATTFFPDFDRSKYNKTVLQKGSEDDLSYTIDKYEKS